MDVVDGTLCAPSFVPNVLHTLSAILARSQVQKVRGGHRADAAVVRCCERVGRHHRVPQPAVQGIDANHLKGDSLLLTCTTQDHPRLPAVPRHPMSSVGRQTACTGIAPSYKPNGDTANARCSSASIQRSRRVSTSSLSRCTDKCLNASEYGRR